MYGSNYWAYFGTYFCGSASQLSTLSSSSYSSNQWVNFWPVIARFSFINLPFFPNSLCCRYAVTSSFPSTSWFHAGNVMPSSARLMTYGPWSSVCAKTLLNKAILTPLFMVRSLTCSDFMMLFVFCYVVVKFCFRSPRHQKVKATPWPPSLHPGEVPDSSSLMDSMNQHSDLCDDGGRSRGKFLCWISG